MKALLSLATPNRALMMSFFWSRLGARPNPLANWKHAIFCYWVVGDPEAIGASFRRISNFKSPSRY